MGVNVIITDTGREWLSRHAANYYDWSLNLDDGTGTGYQIYNQIRFGEGGWVLKNGRRIPRDITNFKSNNDVDILENPSLYGDRYYYTNESGTSNPSFLDLAQSNIVYNNQSSEDLRINIVLQETQENNIDYVDPNDPNNDRTGENPIFFECMIFDNAFDIKDNMNSPPSPFDDPGLTKNNGIIYVNYDGFAKSSDRKHTIKIDIPFNP